MNYQDLKKIGNLSLVASLITILALNVEPARAGVFPASGDTTDTTSVLWGRSTEPGPLQFEYGTDPTFANLQGAIVGNVVDPYLPVKVPVSALAGGNTYYYRVTNAVGETATGRFQTPAPLGERPGLRFGVSGDWRGELAPYPAIRNAASRDLNFFVKLGDTIYADYPSPAVPASQATT